MTRTLAALIALLPAAVWGQTTTSEIELTLPSGGGAFSRDACVANDKLTVSYSCPNCNGAELTLYLADSSSCPEEPPTTGVVVYREGDTLSSSTLSGSEEVSAKEVAGNDCPADTTKDKYVCAVVTYQDQYGSEKKKFRDSQKISYDSIPPAKPAITKTTGGEGAIYVDWSSETVSRFDIYYRELEGQSDTGNELCPEVVSDAGTEDVLVDSPDQTVRDVNLFSRVEVSDGAAQSAQIDGLENDRSYELFIIAQDLAGNGSEQSNVVIASPQTVHDFYRRYRCANGTEEGGFGCSTSRGVPFGTLLLPMLGLAALALCLRRSGRKA